MRHLFLTDLKELVPPSVSNEHRLPPYAIPSQLPDHLDLNHRPPSLEKSETGRSIIDDIWLKDQQRSLNAGIWAA